MYITSVNLALNYGEIGYYKRTRFIIPQGVQKFISPLGLFKKLFWRSVGCKIINLNK